MVGSRDLTPSRRSWPRAFLTNQLMTKPQWPPATTDLAGKTAIVTGSNAGLGYESAIQLLQLRLSHLVMAVRSVDKGEAAAAKLRVLHPSASIVVWQLDMCSYDSVTAFARRVEEQLPHIDFVMLNAGLHPDSFRVVKPAPDAPGHEEAFLVNYLSTVLLTVLLLPVLKAKGTPSGAAPKLSIVSTGLTLTAKFPNRGEVPLLPSFTDEKKFDHDEAYRSSKLLGQMFLWRLVDYVSAADVIVNLPDPGWTAGTNLMSEKRMAEIPAPARGLANMLGRTVPVGASCLVDGLVTKGPESHGSFLFGWKIHPFASMLYTPEGAAVSERVWDETMDELEFAGVRGIIESTKRV